MMISSLPLLYSVFLISTTLVCFSQAFVSPTASVKATRQQVFPLLAAPETSSSPEISTLTDETTWKLRINLKGIPTEKGRKVDEFFVIEAHFIEEEGYEPPQGFIRQILKKETDDSVNGEAEATTTNRLEVVNSRWQLSEDPDDRKDGLWVWGLFAEPLYPFMLLQIETDKVLIPGEDKDYIKPLKLYAQINHKRNKDNGDVTLDAATLNVRVLETVKADIIGAATVEVYEELDVGQIRFETV